MSACHKIFFMVAASTCSAYPWSVSIAQTVVNDSAFCKVTLRDRDKCPTGGIIQNKHTVKISELVLGEKGVRRVYLWANLDQQARKKGVSFISARSDIGDSKCYQEDKPKVSDKRLLEDKDGWFSWLLDLGKAGAKNTGALIDAALSRLELTYRGVGVKFHPVNVPVDVIGYNIFDYRDVPCPGKFDLVVVNSDAEAVEGNNNPRHIEILVVP